MNKIEYEKKIIQLAKDNKRKCTQAQTEQG